ncbi:hypothetical protein D9758_003836 [Tetrapyrgos nigripes]|uniref:Uncharacterized protein n=1 Tax=Tetrapyrgos nigripes TaxID=182062 RepID=A0A8H5LRR7_9AGAR|nr:hypothetical protein D9758_003836 [Tetrapyrgos nigripes]
MRENRAGTRSSPGLFPGLLNISITQNWLLPTTMAVMRPHAHLVRVPPASINQSTPESGNDKRRLAQLPSITVNENEAFSGATAVEAWVQREGQLVKAGEGKEKGVEGWTRTWLRLVIILYLDFEAIWLFWESGQSRAIVHSYFWGLQLVRLATTASKATTPKSRINTPNSRPKASLSTTSTPISKSTLSSTTSTAVAQQSSHSSISSVGTDTPILKAAPIPDFRNTWKTSGCDTFNALLFRSERPFEEFVKNSPDFLIAVQSVVPALYDSEYKVKKGDAIYEGAYKRIIDKRSDIGDKAQDVVKDFFKQERYASDAAARQEYARWALRANGPLLFAQPGAPGTKEKPKDAFLSPHIIEVVKRCLPSSARSVVDIGIPVGLLGLAAAGLERAFRCYLKTGEKEQEGGFREQFVGMAVSGYVKNAVKNVSQNRWQRILDACGLNKEPEDAMKVDASDDEMDISANRHLLYDASSPPGSPSKA